MALVSIPHFPTTCRGCGEALSGEDPEPHRHQVIEIPKIEPFVIEHQLHRSICPHCHTTTCAELPAGVESGGFGPQLSALVGLLGGVYQLSHRKVRGLLEQVLGVEISTGAINAIRYRLSESLASLVEAAATSIRVRCSAAERLCRQNWSIDSSPPCPPVSFTIFTDVQKRRLM